MINNSQNRDRASHSEADRVDMLDSDDSSLGWAVGLGFIFFLIALETLGTRDWPQWLRFVLVIAAGVLGGISGYRWGTILTMVSRVALLLGMVVSAIAFVVLILIWIWHLVGPPR